MSDSDDEEQARRIRTQMSALQGGLSQVDQKKQQDDRAKLLAAAEKRVSARMHNMDEKVYNETGKVPPALLEEWETKARERAEKERQLAANQRRGGRCFAAHKPHGIDVEPFKGHRGKIRNNAAG